MSCKPTGRDCTNWKKIVNRVLTAQAITEARRVVYGDAELGDDEHPELDSLLDEVLDELGNEFEDSEDKLWTAIQVLETSVWLLQVSCIPLHSSLCPAKWWGMLHSSGWPPSVDTSQLEMRIKTKFRLSVECLAPTLAEVPLFVPEMVKWWGWTHELNTE